MIFLKDCVAAQLPDVILRDRSILEDLLKKHSIPYADIDRMLAEPRLAFQILKKRPSPPLHSLHISTKTKPPRLRTSDGAVLLWLQKARSIGQRAYHAGSAVGHHNCRYRSGRWTWPHTGGKPPWLRSQRQYTAA